MGLHQSKGALLYDQVNYGNAEGIRALRREGADLEWIDKEGKTPLTLACMRPELLHVVAVLLELGANVNAYRPGCHAGTPLHHAAKRGLVQTVELLLSRGANPLMMNDDCQTALDLARAKGHWNVVRLIESRICIFAGWLREANWPSMLEAIVRQWVSKKIWVVIYPCDSRNPTHLKLELAIYPELQAAQPRVVLALWKVHIEAPTFSQPDPVLVITEKAKKTRHKFLSEHEGDKQQLQLFYEACRGISQVNNYIPARPTGATTPFAPEHSSHASESSSLPPKAAPEDDVELAMAINASIQSAIAEGVVPDPQPTAETGTSFNGWDQPSENVSHNGWVPPEVTTSQEPPSAPPLMEEAFYAGPIEYPAIDSSPVDMAVIPPLESKPGGKSEGKELENKPGGKSEGKEGVSGCCVICLDAPAEGACIPCGHVAGCMSCLNEIKKKKWGCPVCRANIEQIIKLYAV